MQWVCNNISRREDNKCSPGNFIHQYVKRVYRKWRDFFIKEMERYRFFYHSNLHLTTILENAISKPLIHKIKENKYLSRLKCKWYIDRFIMRTLKFISQQNWKYIILLSISTHGWNWFPKEMCFIDFLMTLTLQYCNCQYYLSQHKFYFISTKNAEMVSFSSKCSVFSFYVIRQLVLNLRGRSRLFFLFLVIFQTNQVHIWVFISRRHVIFIQHQHGIYDYIFQ